MFWSYYTRTYSDCWPSIVLSVSRHLKHSKAIYSVNRDTKANLNRKHCYTTGIGVTIDVKDV